MQIQAHTIRLLFLPLLAQKLTHTSQWQWQWQWRGGQDEGSGHATAVAGGGVDSAVAGPPGRAAGGRAGRGEARSGLRSERPPEVLTKRAVERNAPRGRLRSLSPPQRGQRARVLGRLLWAEGGSGRPRAGWPAAAAPALPQRPPRGRRPRGARSRPGSAPAARRQRPAAACPTLPYPPARAAGVGGHVRPRVRAPGAAPRSQLRRGEDAGGSASAGAAGGAGGELLPSPP